VVFLTEGKNESIPLGTARLKNRLHIPNEESEGSVRRVGRERELKNQR